MLLYNVLLFIIMEIYVKIFHGLKSLSAKVYSRTKTVKLSSKVRDTLADLLSDRVGRVL